MEQNGNNKMERFISWFSDANGPYLVSAFHRKRNSCNALAHEPSLATWQARVLEVANREISHSSIPEFKGDDRWIENLAKKSYDADGPAKAKELLKKQGIILVIEPHLPKTYLDGATMQSHDGIPIVALTLRKDRLDYFWFTLFYELGHVYCHLFNRLNNGFMDLKVLQEERLQDKLVGSDKDDLETEADSFATERLIDSDIWDSCVSRFSVSCESVLADAARLHVHPSIIAGRIRYEQNNYTILNDLIGEGKVRKHFQEFSRRG